MSRVLLRHVVQRTLVSGRRHPLAHVLWVLLSAVCLYGLAWVGFAVLRAPLVLPDWLAGADAVVYLRADASSLDAERVAEELKTWPEIGSTRLVSRDEAHRRLEKQLGSWKGILSGMGRDFLQPSVEVSFEGGLKDPERRGKTIDRIRLVPNVVEILYGNGEGDKLKSFLNLLERGGWLLAGSLVLMFIWVHWGESLIIILQSRDEMEVLWWVGAPDWSIRLPFLLASWTTGTVGAIMAIALFALTIRFSSPQLPLPLAALMSIDRGEWLMLGCCLTGISLLMGSFGVFLATGHMRRLCSNGHSS